MSGGGPAREFKGIVERLTGGLLRGTKSLHDKSDGLTSEAADTRKALAVQNIHIADELRADRDAPSMYATRLEQDAPTSRTYLTSIYGDRFHTNDSEPARKYADSLTLVPEQMHLLVAAHMNGRKSGGIWLGDTAVTEFGHPTIKFKGTPEGWHEGQTWSDVPAVYSHMDRALLVGKTDQRFKEEAALHEFGHAVDHALGSPSHKRGFSRIYAQVMPIIDALDPDGARYFGPSNPGGKDELFASGLAWFYHNPDAAEFSNSSDVARHLKNYFRDMHAHAGISLPP
ncbi:hypothetical protein [Nocardia sp. NPDC051463]|uniref:hypothetical protein n=1 Tax=Nocardia sp. NPDC051463 TaxID=3154845 RepID=UPI00344F026F